MKANKVLKLLQISRPTLTAYVKRKWVIVKKQPNGQYDYDEDSVYKLLNKDVRRKTIIYARVSTPKQRQDLQNQIELLKSFCFQNGWKLDEIYQDIASGISFEKRIDFFKMLDEVLNHKVEKVIISYKDRLSRVGFELFLHLFKKFDVEIVVTSEIGSEKLDSQEIFEEIVSLLHCYSMKLYSKRRKQKVEELCHAES
jgi:predicted site-specific integrase-resolvase